MQDSPPVSGTVLWIRERRWRVEMSRREGRVIRLDVRGPSGPATFLVPFDRPVLSRGRTRPVARRYRHGRAVIGALAARAFTVRTLASAVGARIALLPHQLEPALAIEDGARRVLVADDVGLGKTIEAGLVLAERLRRQPVTRALLVVPSGLRDQWAAELAERFDIACRMADPSTLEAVSRDIAHGDSPWLRAGVWIGSLDYLKQPHVFAALPVVPWDLVVIDEAHAAAGHSDRHRAADALGRRARRLVLLSATPHSGDDERFRRLMTLGSTGHANDTLTVFRRTRESVGMARPRRVSWRRVMLSTDERTFLDALVAFERATLAAAGPGRRNSALLLLSIFRKRALSTARAAASTLQRRLSWLDAGDAPTATRWTQPALGFDDGDELTDEERTGIAVETGLGERHERAWLGRLVTLAHSAARVESKVGRLLSLVTRAREPVVIFTEFRASLEVLVRNVPKAWRPAVLHGGLTQAERRDALGLFRRGDARVLVATDVAGQGLNLQQASRWVVSLELPWNPARLEQRFGRVDRIGRTRTPHLSLFVARHEAEDGILAHLARRTLTARRALGPDTLGHRLAR